MLWGCGGNNKGPRQVVATASSRPDFNSCPLSSIGENIDIQFVK